ncbi:MAG: hypothetical protein Q4G70_05725 [Pseudomonadota bacterium]|nr:hypothetical protein [Pseudomonadota bacterium]
MGYRVLIFFVALLPWLAHGQPQSSGYTTKMIVQLARDDQFMDMHYVAKALQLPDLVDEAVWMGPVTSVSDLSFSAFYDPPRSALGIEKVVFNYRPVFHQEKPYMLIYLSLFFREGQCPAVVDLERASGSKVSRFEVPASPHSRERAIANYVSVRQPHTKTDEADIDFNNDSLCHLRITKQRNY